MLRLSTIKLCKSAHATTRTYFERRFMTHGHFESTFSKYAFGRGGGGHKKEYAVYARENDDNYGRPLTSLRNFGNSVYPALPVSFGGDTKSRRSLLSGVYARGSKRSHQSALECVTVVDSTTHSKLPDPQSAIMRRKTLPCTCIGRRRRRS